MKYYFPFLISILFIQVSQSQIRVSKQTIDSGGQILTNGQTHIFYSLAPIVKQESQNGNLHLSEGFISPDLLQILGFEDFDQNILDVNIYPNPVTNFVYVKLINQQNFNIQLIDLNGKTIWQKSCLKKNCKIDMTKYKRATYYLIISQAKQKRFKYIKLIKN